MNSLSFFQISEGGLVQVYLLRYENDGKLADGDWCDSTLYGDKLSDCDTELTLCLHNTKDMKCTPYGGSKFLSNGDLGGGDSILFGVIGQTLTEHSKFRNPLVFPFSGLWSVSEMKNIIVPCLYLFQVVNK